MGDLISGLVRVKDPITLLAFLALVALFAFRTKKVPEFMFGILQNKLSREHFTKLLHRGMTLGFAAFVLVCVLAGFGQVLDYRTKARPVAVAKAAAEVHASGAPSAEQDAALESYRAGLLQVERGEFQNAIASIQASLDRVPTLAAQYTLAYLYHREGNTEKANELARQVAQSATERGDALTRLRAERLIASESAEPAGNSSSMVDSKTALPGGGADFSSAVPIRAGTYVANAALAQNEYRYFRIQLRVGQQLLVKFRTPNVSNAYAGIGIYDADGGVIARQVIIGRPSGKDSLAHTAAYSGNYFLSIGNEYNANATQTVYSIMVIGGK